MSDQQYSKWVKWIKTIQEQVSSLSLARHVFRDVQKIIENNPNIHQPSLFYELIANSYVAWTLMAIRRQVKDDTHNDAISLVRLLNKIVEHPEVLSRKRFVELYTVDIEDDEERAYAELSGNTTFDDFGIDYIDAHKVASDASKFLKSAEICETYADKRLAHFDKKGPGEIPTHKNIDETIDILEELVKKYYLLLTARGLAQVLPFIQYDWKAVFNHPWLPVDTDED